ncbi:28S ribosomal protein S18b, mitochondrial [Merluccius polli]|uniref:Small ribosomal subunit protein mS40 n=1 Tax=Merluccius polli TaxID=89951 RepID=A0AA47P098_MERPO|nr:28S ribosomal protein S18b, mitochondrial [Merluccius polli]
MAAPIQGIGKFLCRISTPVLRSLLLQKPCSQKPVQLWSRSGSAFAPRRQSFCTALSIKDATGDTPNQAAVRYKDTPWDYLESEEYIERYGTNPVWADYRRNHKGGIPPQKTRKTCIASVFCYVWLCCMRGRLNVCHVLINFFLYQRGDKICGNPCPICRDPNVIIHHQNVKLLQQFINPYSGTVYDPTRTGVCMKQQKVLNEAVNMARDHGLLPFQIPHVEFMTENFSNSHDAVGSTPTSKCLTSGKPWYIWYGKMVPDEKEVAKVKKIYKAYLK